LNGEISTVLDEIDAAEKAITSSQADAAKKAAIEAYAKRNGFKSTEELVEHFDLTHLTFKWIRQFNTLSQTPDTSSATIQALSNSLDADMATLLKMVQNPEAKAVYQVLETARQELKASLGSFDPPIDSISHQVQFIVSWSGSATPNWSLVSFKGPGPASGAFLAGSHSDTHTLTIVMGSPGATGSILNAPQIGTSIGNTLSTTTVRVTAPP
jgi:hypothetical protein